MTQRTPTRPQLTLALAALMIGSAAHAQNVPLNPALLQNIQLQPLQVRGMQFGVQQVNQTLFSQALNTPNAQPFKASDLAAQLDARDLQVRNSLTLTARLQGLPDLRADIARTALKLPEGLTVPASVTLRGGERKEVLLFGRDTVALNIANAEENAPRNRAAILNSFGLDEQNPVPREFLSEAPAAPATPTALTTTAAGRASATTAARATATLPIKAPSTTVNPNILLQPNVSLQNLLPKPDPSQPGKELGDGFVSTPSDGACRFTPTNPLFSQMRGSNINLITTIKDQGRRGTCMSFAYVSALESLIARRIQTRFNLSEQYAYYWLRGDDTVLGDGAGWGDYDDIINRQRMIPTEVRWTYNPSRSRVRVPADTTKPITEFRNSCTGYTQTCTDTTPQARVLCLIGNTLCVFLPEWVIQEQAAFNFRPTQGNEIWHSLGSLPFKDPAAGRAYRRQMMRQMLNRGDQLILGFAVDGAFDSIGASGQPNMNLMGQNYRGGHAVHIVGYVNQGKQTFNNVKLGIGPVDVNLGTMTFDTGVWIIKNSWSCSFGDGGYAYLPDSFLDTEANGVYNLKAGAVASDMANF